MYVPSLLILNEKVNQAERIIVQMGKSRQAIGKRRRKIKIKIEAELNEWF